MNTDWFEERFVSDKMDAFLLGLLVAWGTALALAGLFPCETATASGGIPIP